MANRPEHQHFIPKSYLKKFAIKKGKSKFFLEAKQLGSDRIYRDMSTRDICVQSNLYTVPDEDIEKRYVLENYYAHNVDAAYPEIYDILTDEKRNYISTDQKYKILYTVISLYFRTPKFLNAISFADDLELEKSVERQDGRGLIKIEWNDGYKSLFHVDDLNEEKLRRREFNRIKFLRTHLEEWHNFVYNKNHGVINVFKVPHSVPLITSDNPIQIGSDHADVNLFSPDNFIQLPLGPHLLLWIAPYSINNDRSQLNKIYRQYRDESFAVTSNSTVERLAERWIFGQPGSISQHISDQIRFNKPEVAEPLVEGLIKKTYELMQLVSLMERHGLASIIVANKVKEMRRLAIFKDSLELQGIIEALAKRGFLTV
ncbi:DUF4238 domain-containing protein [Dyadobacter sp. LHD-138]|uniref:DUF4238 domain-containing protein n=1 Tax=Dyadobacter sp. LHD-138 TaxID=3071413 RepID=UPI0027E0D869|nr:DUF4238 domain-containing protein [Dyadobacter sp. LHD-138]MDQ6482419.1 DUF4238 domain-containing protein [Dyadobacter sp. LHD-138]